jgi:hypothetical protein
MNVAKERWEESAVGDSPGSGLPRIPETWFRRAAACGRHAMIVGVEVWGAQRRQRAWNRGGGVVVNASRVERRWPITRASVAKGLRELEQAGLIDMLREPGRAARVRILRVGKERTR